MLTLDRIKHLTEPLAGLSFEDRVEIAHALGLLVACCETCGCYLNKPGCHSVDDATGISTFECPCPDLQDDDDEDDE